MKKLLSLCLVFFLLLCLLPGKARAQYETSRFALKLYGGLNYLAGGDLNAGLKGWSELYALGWGMLGWSTPDEFKNAGLGMGFGGDFMFQFGPSLGIGLGVGYVQASSKSDIHYTHALPAIPDIDEVYEVKASAIPITASFYYFLPSAGPVAINLHAGLGYYLASVYARYHWALTTAWNQNVYDNLPGSGLGFHGGIGVEFKLSPMIGIFVEGQGRYAPISNFEGDNLYTDSSGTSVTSSGQAWVFDLSDFGRTFTLSGISQVKPSGSGISNAHQAKVDFSGFSFVLGFIIRL